MMKSFVDARDEASPAISSENLDHPTVIPAIADAILMFCPDTQSKEIGMTLTAIKNAGFRSFKIIYANGDLQRSQLLSKDPTKSEDAVKTEAYSMNWFTGHKSQIARALEISEENLNNEVFCFWDDFIVAHTKYSEFFEVAVMWFLSDAEFRIEILRSVLGYLKTYCAKASISLPDLESINYPTLLATDVESLGCSVMKSFRHSLEYKLKEVAGLLVKAESRAHILLYAGNLDPGISAAVNKIHQLEQYKDYILFQKIERQKTKQTLSFQIPGKSESTVKFKRDTAPTITGVAKYALFDAPKNPSYESLVLVLHNAVANAKDPQTALLIIADIQRRLSDYQMRIITSSITSSQGSNTASQDQDNDRGIFYQQ